MTTTKSPLEDLMVAMDVVDTLRHQDRLVDRELDSDGRRERLIEQLRDIYLSQGIEVSDAVLEEGVLALEQDRFSYKRSGSGLSRRFAGWYVGRDSWLKPLLGFFVLLSVITLAYYFLEVRPSQQQQAIAPAAIEQHYQQISQIAVAPEARQSAEQLYLQGKRAIEQQDHQKANVIASQLAQQKQQLEVSYDIRVVNQPGEKSGVWRVPEMNLSARNYYLIVEGIDNLGEPVNVVVSDEETGKRKQLKRWGLRVSEEIYQRIGADKSDDGIIQKNHLGRKLVGHLRPEYEISTSGATITEW